MCEEENKLKDCSQVMKKIERYSWLKKMREEEE